MQIIVSSLSLPTASITRYASVMVIIAMVAQATAATPTNCTSDFDCEPLKFEQACGTWSCSMESLVCVNTATKSNTTVCRAAAGPCDVADICDGVTTQCPDTLKVQGSMCRPDAGPCDVEEVCDGLVASCPVDVLKPFGDVCRRIAGDCDLAEVCTGVSTQCPSDKLRNQSTVCRHSAGECDVAERCTGKNIDCPADHFLSTHVVCRDSMGNCDAEETCSGNNAHCPIDSKMPASTVCRTSSGACDAAEYCDGATDNCGVDAKLAAGTACSAKTDNCDLPDVCNGQSDACQYQRHDHSYVHNVSGQCVSCGIDTDNCTALAYPSCLDNCFNGTESSVTMFQCQKLDGSVTEIQKNLNTNSCAIWPAECVADTDCLTMIATGSCQKAICNQGKCTNLFLPTGAVCRASAGDCDAIEMCSGSDIDCPADSMKRGNVCRASQGACDEVEHCTGESVTCPADALATFDRICRHPSGPCSVATRCTGNGTQCPISVVAPNTTVCRPAAGDCDVPEFCTGVHGECPADFFAPTNTVCRASRGACDVAEVCTNGNAACPADSLRANLTVCRSAAGLCDSEEICDGVSDECPADKVMAANTTCGTADSTDKCHLVDKCDGFTFTCHQLRKDYGWANFGSGLTCNVDVEGSVRYDSNPWMMAFCGTPTHCYPDANASNFNIYQCQKATGVMKLMPAASLDANNCMQPLAECVVDSDCLTMVSTDSCEKSQCINNTCVKTVQNSSNVCRAATGACDVEERCNGVDVACPADNFKRGDVCRRAVGPCDLDEVCSGDSVECPVDILKSSSFVCRGSAGSCDVAEFCTGNSTACPGDAVAPNTTLCRASAGSCDSEEFCSGTATNCPSDYYLPAATICRVALGSCDVAETCSGNSPVCPNDSLKTNGTVCRAADGACDAEEKCDGVALDCPVDEKKSAGTVCRNVTDACDMIDTCTGSSNTCSSHRKDHVFLWSTNETHGVTCGVATANYISIVDDIDVWHCGATICPNLAVNKSAIEMYQCQKLSGDLQLIETNVDSESNCPVWPSECDVDADCLTMIEIGSCEFPVCSAGKCTKSFHNTSTVCRASGGSCDLAEYCSGSTASCPQDALVSNGHMCRASAGPCDAVEMCDGVSAECPADAFAGHETTCRLAAAICDATEFCSGESAECPADVLASTTTLCRDAVGDCDIPEYCSNTSVECPADAFRPSDAVCRDSLGACDPAEMCSGNNGFCPGDSLASNGTVCRAAEGACDVAEVCSGTSTACPVNQIKAANTICGPMDADNQCDLQDVCDGASTSCLNRQKWIGWTYKSNSTSFSCGVETTASTVSASHLCHEQTCLLADAANTDVVYFQCQHLDGSFKPIVEPTLDNQSCIVLPAQCEIDTDCLTMIATEGCEVATCDAGVCKKTLRDSRFVCRAAAGACDMPETCDGASAACPADAFAPPAVLCRIDAGPCDVAEFCTGQSSVCPVDTMKTADTICRASAGTCDVAETCTGSSAACPVDAFAANTTVCRAATVGFTCDEPDFCTGDSYACNNDRVRVEGATCQTFTGKISSCDGLSKRCSNARVNVTVATNNEVVEVAEPAAPVVGQEGETLEERAITYSCEGTCYICGANVSRDVVFAADGSANLRQSADECSMGQCTELVVLPFPRCLETCVSRTCPNNKPAEKAAFFRHNVEEFKCVNHTATEFEACPPWDHFSADERLPEEGIAGGDPRYSVNGAMVQCDVLGEVLYAQNSNYSIYVHHTAIGAAQQATYIDSMRVAFAAVHVLPDVVIAVGGWESQTLTTATGMTVAVHDGGIYSTDIPMSLTVDVSNGMSLRMINFGFTGMEITSGIMVSGCPQEPTSQADVPAHPACANLAAHLQVGCNFDMWATNGDEDVASANVAMAQLVALVEYQQPESVPVTVEMKAAQTQTAAVASGAGSASSGSTAGAAAGAAVAQRESTGLNMTAIIAAGVSCFALVTVLAVGLVVRNRKSPSSAGRLDGEDDKVMTTKGLAADPVDVVIGIQEASMSKHDDAVIKFMGASMSLSGRNPMKEPKKKASAPSSGRSFNTNSMSLSAVKYTAGENKQQQFLRPNSGGQTAAGEESVNRLDSIQA